MHAYGINLRLMGFFRSLLRGISCNIVGEIASVLIHFASASKCCDSRGDQDCRGADLRARRDDHSRHQVLLEVFVLEGYNQWRSFISLLRNRVRSTGHHDAVNQVVRYLNVIFGRSRASTYFWLTWVLIFFYEIVFSFLILSFVSLIKIQLSTKYDVYGPSFLLTHESSPTYDLRSSLSLFALFGAVLDDMGIEYE